MRTSKQAGFGAVIIIILAILFVVIVGFIAWRMATTTQPDQNQGTSQSKEQPEQSSQSTPGSNEGYIVIKEWGVRFKPVDSLSGAEYFKPSSISFDAVSISTAALAAKEPMCGKDTTMIPVGLLRRSMAVEPEAGEVLATINGYTYQYRGSDAPCSQNESNYDLETQTRTAIAESVKSLEAAK